MNATTRFVDKRVYWFGIMDGLKIMTDIMQTLCFLLIVTCLGACLIAAFCEIEAARRRRRERSQFVREAMRTVVSVTKRGK